MVFWVATEVQQGIVEAADTIVAALIVGVAGGLIGSRYTRERDRIDEARPRAEAEHMAS